MNKILLLTSLLITCSSFAHAHPAKDHSAHYDTTTRQTISYHWVYISARYINGHWVTAHWKKVAGPHPHANRPGWHFIKGHHTRINGHRVWVHGYWAQAHNNQRKNSKKRR